MFKIAAAAGTFVLSGFFAIPLAFAPGDLPPVSASDAGLAIPAPALIAYQRSASTCPGLRWELLAAVGQVESGHGTTGGASIGPDGIASPPILGPPLDGSGAGGNTTPMPAGPLVWTVGNRRSVAPGRRTDAVPAADLRCLGRRR